MGLQRYRAKRDFRRTSEPAGDTPAGKPSDRRLTFVVQKHDATRLHYDFRLEMAGVLKSWAVPKGIPTTRGDRRLAVEVEDHPLDYGGFEGTIPPGSYGAGTVMLWDRGTYTVSGPSPLQAWKEGKLHLYLKGKKLKGEWTLVKIRHPRDERQPPWLIFKTGDDVPTISAKQDDTSVLSGKSMARIATDNDREWQSNRPSEPASLPPKRPRPKTPATRRKSSASAAAAKGLRVTGLETLPPSPPRFVEPMKATSVKTLPQGPEWTFEIKFDGIRALAIKNGARIDLLSRTNNVLTHKYPPLVEAFVTLPVKECVLDGEIVVLDDTGKSSFQLLQSYNQPGQHKLPLVFYAFDILQLDGRNLTGLPLTARKTVVGQILSEASDRLLLSGGIDANSQTVVKAMQDRGLEGLIAKLKNSKYVPSRRSSAWLKYKWSLAQEFVIGGYTAPQGSRTHFGALLVGYYQKSRLICAGKVGTGFDERLLKNLFARFQKLKRPDCPFTNLPAKPGAGLTRSQMRHCTWINPELVAQVRFTEWTREGMLRQPSFQGLREDKKPSEVVRETVPDPPG